MHSLRELFEKAGGIEACAKACGISSRALYKWASRNSLPRTEYTGETNYAEALAGLVEGSTATQIREAFTPNQAVA